MLLTCIGEWSPQRQHWKAERSMTKKVEKSYARITIDYFDSSIRASIDHGVEKLNATKIELSKRAIFREFNRIRRECNAGSYTKHAEQKTLQRQEAIEKEQADVH